jgi:hypothetical protein
MDVQVVQETLERLLHNRLPQVVDGREDLE